MPVTSRTSTTAAKPYDRKAKGKGKAVEKDEGVNRGAPAQLSQSSRKGKKAWRKNVDVTAEEIALERARAEERTHGKSFGKSDDGDLFMVDTVGDAAVAKKMKREKKPLRSLAVLAKKEKMSSKDKARLRRIARRTVEDTASADVRQTDVDSLHDAWVAAPKQKGFKGGFGDEAVIKHAIKTPETLAKQREMRLAAVASQLDDEVPTAGVSYNPAEEAHARLIAEALEEEKRRLAKEAREAEEIAKLGGVVDAWRQLEGQGTVIDGEVDIINGMRVGRGDGVESDSDDDEDEDEEGYKPKPTKRKTQAQRNKAARTKAALLAAKQEALKAKIEKGISTAKVYSKSVAAKQAAADEAARLRKVAAEQRERLGFSGGEKIGKHRVGNKAVEVQLGEDLAESLRQVKPEGNLFKDRFLSLQRRALLEPRVLQLPRRKRTKTKEYEKHAWKNFE